MLNILIKVYIFSYPEVQDKRHQAVYFGEFGAPYTPYNSIF